MSKGLIYAGEFAGLGGNAWRAEIWQEGFSGNPEELSFPADEPLLIEWGHKDKHEVICGSAATLKVISPGDRTYVGLYGIAPSRTRLDVLLNGKLFWRGCLDPEFYEEPYEAARGYEVELTFSDFGQWERMRFASAGFLALRDILAECLERVDLGGLPVSEDWISTYLSAGAVSSSSGLLGGLMVQGDNFYDEDGEASTLDEVVEGVLQPLALRIVQKAGRIIVYDLNGAYARCAPAAARWNGDRQTLGVDPVYNNVVVTWSQYSRTGSLTSDECWKKDIPTPKGETNVGSRYPAKRAGGRAEILSYPLDRTFQNDYSALTLWTSEEGDGLEIYAKRDEMIGLGSLPGKKPVDNALYADTSATPATRGARFFRIVPQGGSEEAEGVALFWRSFFIMDGSSMTSATKCQEYGIFRRLFSSLKTDEPKNVIHSLRPRPVFGTRPLWIPPGDPSASQFLKLTMGLLVDQRFNNDGDLQNLDPYEIRDSGDPALNDSRSAPYRNADSEGATLRYGNFLYVPVFVEFRPDNGGGAYYWSNLSGIFQPTDSGLERRMENFYGCWAKMPEDIADIGDGGVPMKYTSYLAYYEINDDGANATPSKKWSTNKLAVYPKPHNDGGFDSRWQKNAEGQLIPYPGSGAERYGSPYVDGSIVPSWTHAGEVPNRYGGTLRVYVLENVWYWANEHRIAWEAQNGPGDIWTYVNWVLCKPPQVGMVDRYGSALDAPDDSDIEYRATVNADAKEDLKIDTVCGTNGTRNAFARGNYYYKSRPAGEDGDIVRTLYRQGRTAQAEKLLIGTMYSQYGTRHVTLSGEADMETGASLTFSEANQGDRRFLLTAEELDCMRATSDMELTELSPDEWDELEINEQTD